MKTGALIFSLVLISILSVHLVAAALPAPPITFNKIGDFFNDLLKGTQGEDTLARLLLVMLLTTILFKPANQIVGKKPGLAFIVALLISILGIRFFTSYEMIRGLMLPYGALAIVLSTLIPFLLFGFLLESSEAAPMLRKIGWGLLGGAFIMLWWLRWTDIGDMAYIYLVLGIIAFVILWFNGQIHLLFSMQNLEKGKRRQILIKTAEIQDEMDDLIETLSSRHLTKEQRKAIKGEINDLQYSLKELSKQT